MRKLAFSLAQLWSIPALPRVLLNDDHSCGSGTRMNGPSEHAGKTARLAERPALFCARAGIVVGFGASQRGSCNIVGRCPHRSVWAAGLAASRQPHTVGATVRTGSLRPAEREGWPISPLRPSRREFCKRASNGGAERPQPPSSPASATAAGRHRRGWGGPAAAAHVAKSAATSDFNKGPRSKQSHALRTSKRRQSGTSASCTLGVCCREAALPGEAKEVK